MGMTYDQLMRQQNSARVVQEEYDNAFKKWGMSAPAPVVGEVCWRLRSQDGCFRKEATS